MKEKYIYSKPKWSKNDPKEIIIHNVPNSSKVLDVGCGIGALGSWLKKNKSCVVDGIEFHPEAVKMAKRNLDIVEQVNLNDLSNLKNFLKGKKYDCIVLVDVLEHCLYPAEILSILKKHLNNKGKILLSLPNVANYEIRISLLRGNFNYADSGIMDKTHLKFYTRKTINDLLLESGLSSKQLGFTLPTGKKWKVLSVFSVPLFAIQYVFEARK